ncbi:rho GTPase-activating protein 2-like [Cornus florida]|uniref:rho GTPase-activating protein 2-like n=1 Tax=Cornus florida TaxID=4283 RepID=UPI002899A713|nr:rho GTPase-activating protein 2-like [Cornus florida]
MTGMVMVTNCGGGKRTKGAAEDQQNQLSLVALLLAAIRKSMVSCRVDQGDEVISTVHHMEIGWPTNVQHVTHVTFDRFNGFLGLPVEFEVEVPGRVPSASASVFGVSAESMQLSYDSRGNSVPTILLLMQERLYSQEGLKAEGIFRINPENSQEEHVRNQLNRGIVPNNIDVHCLAGLIKAWFRELPSGVLDGLSPEQVLECNTEEGSVELVNQLQPTEAALLNWAIDLMADVVEQEESNKMNARNIAMVFAPNMTQMSDPLTALMHAVQVMNLLKTLIMKTLREREETATGGYSPMSSHSSDRQTNEEFESEQETDTSCELIGPMSDHNDHDLYSHNNEEDEEPMSDHNDHDLYSHMNEDEEPMSEHNDHDLYSHSSEDEDEDESEVVSSSEIEEYFLRQFDDNDNAKNNILEVSEGDLLRKHVSPTSDSTSNGVSGVSLSGSGTGSSCLSTSDGEDERGSPIAVGRKEEHMMASSNVREVANDVGVDKFVESAIPMPLLDVQ